MYHESNGELAESLTCYDQALRLNQNEPEYQLGRYKCMKKLGTYMSLLLSPILEGHWDAMLSLISKEINSEKQKSNAAISLAIGAAWRLERWTEVEDLIKKAGTFQCWEIALAK